MSRLESLIRILSRIKNELKELKYYSFFNTLYLNFKVLPYSQAIKFPIKVGKNVEIIGVSRGSITFNKDVSIRPFMIRLFICKTPMYANKGNYSLIRFTGGGTLTLGTDIDIYSGCRIILVDGGCIAIGSDTLINQNCLIYSSLSTNIGEHCRFGWDCQIYDNDFHLIYNESKREIKSPYGKISIGNNVWIANSCTITKNTTIPSYSIVASNSLVNHDFSYITSRGNLFIGIPAIHKSIGLYRLLNDSFESETKRMFLKEKCKGIKYNVDFDFHKYLRRKL